MNRKSINIYQRFVEMVNDDYLFYSQDLDGRITYISSNIETFFGITPEDIIGRKWYDVLNTSTHMIERAQSSELLSQDKKIPPPYELELLDFEKKIITLEIQENPVVDENDAVVAIDGIAKNITKEKEHALQLELTISNLNNALEEIHTLKGILPICASCKKVRDDKGYWNQIELFISKHSEAEFSHSICPECIKELYPDLSIDTND